MRTEMENIIQSFTEEMERYERQYNKDYVLDELNRKNQTQVEIAATSYVSGIYTATLWTLGTESAREIKELAEDYDFFRGQTITGIVI